MDAEHAEYVKLAEDRISQQSGILAEKNKEIARLKVELASRNLRITGLEATLEPFANIGLEQDGDKRAQDMISGPDLTITPTQVRAARRILGLL